MSRWARGWSVLNRRLALSGVKTLHRKAYSDLTNLGMHLSKPEILTYVSYIFINEDHYPRWLNERY